MQLNGVLMFYSRRLVVCVAFHVSEDPSCYPCVHPFVAVTFEGAVVLPKKIDPNVLPFLMIHISSTSNISDNRAPAEDKHGEVVGFFGIPENSSALHERAGGRVAVEGVLK